MTTTLILVGLACIFGGVCLALLEEVFRTDFFLIISKLVFVLGALLALLALLLMLLIPLGPIVKA